MEIFLTEKTDMALIILDVQVHMFSPENPVYQGEHLLEKIGITRLTVMQQMSLLI